MRRGLALLLTTLLAVSLAGCGWHLRGSAPGAASLEGVQLAVDSRVGRDELYREVRIALEAAGAEVVSTGSGIPTLRLLDESRSTQRISGGRSDEVRENELRYRLRWEFLDGNGERLVGPDVYQQIRSYRFEQQQVLGSEGREDALVQELRRDAAFLLTDRVQALIGE
ncbi:LPS-assembly lipoprotein [Natronocella acetinitrilica]|uniref:LPS-assembly lipoprotein LptE n=1 Tax=Natronocella acetinitrilica TaxID=414046 RepID=A0AAE3KAW1_9GAMM|nr:LPS assembly lipoprotein LptE [Natronocella acetinitrilica]MCP1673911.1 LPS-assembly lipoprotein [Natronocella acetinitrilica]